MLPENQNNLVTRSWKGAPIAFRTTDGFVNATAMAKATGKEWASYFRTDRATMYLEALSRNCRIAVTSLYIAKPGEGTWIHPRVAVDFARWISPDFAVQMDAWVLEQLEKQRSSAQEVQVPALPSPVGQIKEAAEGLVFIWDAIEKRGLADDRDRIEIKRDLKVLSNALIHSSSGQLPGTSNVLSPLEKLPRFLGRAVNMEAPLTFVEWASCYLPGEVSSVVNKYDNSLGTEMRKLYCERHNCAKEDIPTTNHLSVKAEKARRRLNLPLFGKAKNGNAVTPKIYLPKDWDLFVVAMRHKGVIAPDRAAEFLAECQQFRQGMEF